MDTTEFTMGTSVITGKISGMWNKETRSFDIKRGKSANGNKWQVFEIQVSTKKDDVWINGKGISVMYLGDIKVEHQQKIGLVGYFTADNYINKEGKEVRGNKFMCSNIFEPKDRETVAKDTKAEEEVWW